MGTESTGDLQSELMQAREAKVVLLDGFYSLFPERNSRSATLRLCCLDTLAHTLFHTTNRKKYYNDTPKLQYELEIPTQH